MPVSLTPAPFPHAGEGRMEPLRASHVMEK